MIIARALTWTVGIVLLSLVVLSASGRVPWPAAVIPCALAAAAVFVAGLMRAASRIDDFDDTSDRGGRWPE